MTSFAPANKYKVAGKNIPLLHAGDAVWKGHRKYTHSYMHNVVLAYFMFNYGGGGV